MPAQQPAYRKPYVFTEDWVTHNLSLWRDVLVPLRGRPALHYLEVGVFEGRSLLWMLENVFTHRETRVTGIDIVISERLRANVEMSGQSHRVRLIEGRSQMALRNQPLQSFDLIYVDGSHTAADVLADAVLCWPLLKTGGLLIFDDYVWLGTDDGRTLPDELRPQVAIDAFVTAFRNSMEIVHRGYQLIVRKRTDPCGGKADCSPVGQYLYHWRSRRLVDPRREGGTIELSEDDRLLVERIAKGRKFGEAAFSLSRASPGYKDFVNLAKRLQLRL